MEVREATDDEIELPKISNMQIQQEKRRVTMNNKKRKRSTSTPLKDKAAKWVQGIKNKPNDMGSI